MSNKNPDPWKIHYILNPYEKTHFEKSEIGLLGISVSGVGRLERHARRAFHSSLVNKSKPTIDAQVKMDAYINVRILQCGVTSSCEEKRNIPHLVHDTAVVCTCYTKKHTKTTFLSHFSYFAILAIQTRQTRQGHTAVAAVPTHQKVEQRAAKGTGRFTL